MLIGNFSLGILGLGTAIGAFAGVGPAVTAISDVLGKFVGTLVTSNCFHLHLSLSNQLRFFS
jgi:PTS system mannitol-specific IIC component